MNRRFSVLLIEDNSTDVYLVKEAIADQGLDIDLNVVENGEQALNMIAGIDSREDAGIPDLVLLDINLPRMGGFHVLERIRHGKRSANVPVVVMTSSSASTDRTQSAELGATAYFLKPSGYDDFLKIGEVIRDLLA